MAGDAYIRILKGHWHLDVLLVEKRKKKKTLTTWTFGIFLCVSHRVHPAQMKSVPLLFLVKGHW